MTYEEYKEKQQKTYNALPIGYAYNKEEFKAMMKKLKVKTSKELLYNGEVYYRKEDAELIHKTLQHLAKEHEKLLQDYDFAYEAFMYEMANIEYQLDPEKGNACEAIGLRYDWDNDTCPAFKTNPALAKAFKQAEQDYLKKAEENGWY